MIIVNKERSFNSGTDFFVSDSVDLTACWSCLLRSSVLVLVCTYSGVPATDESSSGSHFFSSPQLSRRVGLNLVNVIESATFHRFSCGNKKNSHGARSGSREGVGGTKYYVSPEIHLW
jgi:hypothetical protein